VPAWAAAPPTRPFYMIVNRRPRARGAAPSPGRDGAGDDLGPDISRSDPIILWCTRTVLLHAWCRWMFAGLSGGIASVVPSRSLELGSLTAKEPGHKKAEYGSSCGRLRNFGRGHRGWTTDHHALSGSCRAHLGGQATPALIGRYAAVRPTSIRSPPCPSV
jgi:hypothetical protein